MVPSRERGLGQPLRLEAGEGGGPLEGEPREIHICVVLLSSQSGPSPTCSPASPELFPQREPCSVTVCKLAPSQDHPGNLGLGRLG